MTNRGRVQYDDAGRLTTQVESNASNVGIYTMVDGYDAVGNRTSRDTNGTPCTWSYDDAYRLTGQQKSGQYATFAYDANSNLTLKWHQGGGPHTMQYDAADRVTTMQAGGTTSTMQWGQRGVLAKLYETGVIKATYSYADITNDLTRSEETGTVTTAAFDGDDLRRKTVLSGVTTTFVWDGYDYLQARRSSGGDSLFVVLGGEVVAEVRDGTPRDFLTDPLGSVVGHLDSSQNLTAEFEYWPYGELVGTAETTDLPFLWVGSLGYHADTTIRTYIRRRAYRQDLGSWMQLDPLWPVEGATTYADGDPVTEYDNTGCQSRNKIAKRRKKKPRFGPRPLRPKPLPFLVTEIIGWGLILGTYEDIDSILDLLGACAQGADGWTIDECRDCCADIVGAIGGAAAGGVASLPSVVTGPFAPLIIVGVGLIGGEVAGRMSRDTLCAQFCIDQPRKRCPTQIALLPVNSGTHLNRGAGGAIIYD